jgi:lipoate-protein ligase B
MRCTAAPQSIFNERVTESNECLVAWLGCVPYPEALDLQMRICELKKQGFDKDVLLLLEHPPTITMGRRGRLGNLLASKDDLKSRGIGFHEVDRGGDITFHGPGQLVGYPILTLRTHERDIHAYMHNLEESLIRLLCRFGIEGMRNSQYTGVWTSMGKIAAMGVHISRWVTRHGFALNVNTDLSFYDLIVPCGIIGGEVASMQKHLSRAENLREVADRYIQEFGRAFGRTMVRTGADDLIAELLSHADGSK